MVDSTSRSSRSVAKILAGGLVLAAVVAVVPAVFWWVGHQAVVSVSASTGIPHCEGTEPTTVQDSHSTYEGTAVPMAEGFACTLTIKVTNRSEREVTLGQIVVPVGGPSAGAGFRVTHLGGEELPVDDEVDAVADLGQSLGPGAEQLVDMRVVFRKSGCSSDGMHMWVRPTIEVSDLLASHALTVADLPAFLGTADSSCDS